MGSYSLSRKADDDVASIARSSFDAWGLRQAENYMLRLRAVFKLLVDFPDLGRDASDIAAGYRRFEVAAHVIFYRSVADHIVIIRVLHARMDLSRHF